MAKQLIAIRLPEKVYKVVEKRAKDLGTTITWVITSSLVAIFSTELPPGYDIGRPEKDWGEKK
jgi:hypothetical protein